MGKMEKTKTWWGEKWLYHVEFFYDDNFLRDGRRILKNNNIKKFEIIDSTVYAKIRTGGYYRKYCDLHFTLNKFNDYEIQNILGIIKDNPLFLSDLLNNELSYEFYEKLLERNIDIFPSYFRYLDGECSCYEWGSLCSHELAVLQFLALEIDKDPLLLFKIQGCDLLKLLGIDEDLNRIKIGEEVFNVDDSRIDDITANFVDFSKIPDLYDEIFFLFNEESIFFKKNFKNILSKIYKALPNSLIKDVDKYTRQDSGKYYNSYDEIEDNSVFSGDEEDYDQWFEEIFLNKWKLPNQWGQFKLHINKKYEISYLKNGNWSYIRRLISPEEIFSFFTELSQSSITKFNPDIQFFNLIYHFSLELIKKHAFVPELSMSGGMFYIRWVPAIFNRNISEIIDALAIDCPDNLVKFKNKRISKKSQVISVVNIFIKGYLSIYFRKFSPKYLKNDIDEDIFKLFFFDGIKVKNNQSNAKSINQWISKFNFNSDYRDLYFVIEEVEDSFKLDIKVNDELNSIKDIIDNTDDINLKITLLKDLYIINELLPEYVDLLMKNEEFILDIDDFSDFFTDTLPLFELIGINIILPKSLNKQLKPYITLNLYSNPKTESFISFKDITEFDWKVQVGDDAYDLEEFKQITKDSKGLVKFTNNYVLLNKNEVNSLIKTMSKLPAKLTEQDLMHSMLAGEFRQAKVNMDNKLNDLISDMLKFEPVDIPESLNANLRNYQETGFSWLVQNVKTGFGSILADDMGLGKTLEVLTAIQYFKDQNMIKKAKILIVAPTGLLTNWQKEIEKFTPNLTSFIYHGTTREFPKEEYDIYLTSYGIIRREYELFNKKKWFLIVVDEAQNIKNPQAKQTRAIKSIKSTHKIAMTGTPVENRLSDYWSIFDFINKGYLTNLARFRKNYILPIEKEQNLHILDNFKKITSPFILRRVKSDKNII